MSTVTELEGASLLHSVALRTSAQEALLKTERSASLFVVCINVACSAAVVAFLAARSEPMFLAIVGGTAGAALALGAASFGESRRLRRRLEAILVLSRGTVA